MSEFEELQPHETELFDRESAAHPSAVHAGVSAVDARIRWLVTERLESLGHSADGWDWLFRDQRDGRLWELTFPFGSLHGSGPRRLVVVTRHAVAAKYGLGTAE